jgi:hypothetical protein
MNGLDFKNLSAEQEKVLREILVTCHYFQLARRCNVGDNVYAQQAEDLGFKFQQLERTLEEKKGI